MLAKNQALIIGSIICNLHFLLRISPINKLFVCHYKFRSRLFILMNLLETQCILQWGLTDQWSSIVILDLIHGATSIFLIIQRRFLQGLHLVLSLDCGLIFNWFVRCMFRACFFSWAKTCIFILLTAKWTANSILIGMIWLLS